MNIFSHKEVLPGLFLIIEEYYVSGKMECYVTYEFRLVGIGAMSEVIEELKVMHFKVCR